MPCLTLVRLSQLFSARGWGSRIAHMAHCISLKSSPPHCQTKKLNKFLGLPPPLPFLDDKDIRKTVQALSLLIFLICLKKLVHIISFFLSLHIEITCSFNFSILLIIAPPTLLLEIALTLNSSG